MARSDTAAPPLALPSHTTDISYAHETEQCIPQIAYFWNISDERGANFVELRKTEVQLRRIPIPGTSVNKGSRCSATNSPATKVDCSSASLCSKTLVVTITPSPAQAHRRHKDKIVVLALIKVLRPSLPAAGSVGRARIPDGPPAITSAGWVARNRSIVRRRPAPRELGRAHRLVGVLRVDAVLHPALGADELLGEGLIGERLLGRNRAVPPVDGALRFAPLHEVAMNRGELPLPPPFDHRLISLPACPLYLQRDRGCRGGGGAGTG